MVAYIVHLPIEKELLHGEEDLLKYYDVAFVDEELDGGGTKVGFFVEFVGTEVPLEQEYVL